MSTTEVELTISTGIRSALGAVRDACSDNNDKVLDLLPFFESGAAVIPYSAIEKLSQVYRSEVPEEDRESLRGECGNGWVHELIRGSDLAVAAGNNYQQSEHEARPAAFEERLERLRCAREKDEARSYLKKGNYDSIEDMGLGASMSFVGEGVNLLACMAGGFVIFWYLGSHIFTGETSAMPVVCGLIGLLLALAVEVILIAVREQKKDIFHSRKKTQRSSVARTRAGLRRGPRAQVAPPRRLHSEGGKLGSNCHQDRARSSSRSGFSEEMKKAIYGDVEKHQTVKNRKVKT